MKCLSLTIGMILPNKDEGQDRSVVSKHDARVVAFTWDIRNYTNSSKETHDVNDHSDELDVERSAL